MKLQAKTEEQIAHIVHILDENNVYTCGVTTEEGVSIDSFIAFDVMADIVDYLRKPVNTDKELFEQCWKDYTRKGSKKVAYDRWKGLNEKDRKSIAKHIPFYVKSNERIYLKDFERYISNRTFESIVVDHKTGYVLYDPEREVGEIGYMPQCGGSLSWNDYYECYLYVGMFYENIADGYTDANRPNGARIMLNNGRGFIIWNGETRKWEKEQ